MNSKISKKDIAFLIGEILFIILLVIRFWDRKIEDTNHLFSFMYNYRIGELITGLFFMSIIGLTAFVLSRAKEDVKKDIYYMAAFLIILLAPMYLCDNYFGMGDVYAWTILMIAAILAMIPKLEWLGILLCVCSAVLSPIYCIAGIFAVFIVVLYKGYVNQDKKNYVYVILGTLLYIALFIYLYFTGNISGVTIFRISLFKFVASFILMLPIFIYIFVFIIRLMKNVKGIGKIICVAMMLGGIVNLAVMVYLGDYSRAMVTTLSFYVLITIMLIDNNDSGFMQVYISSRDAIKKYIPIPVAILIYVFAIITYWYFAKDFIDEESIIEFTLGQ